MVIGIFDPLADDAGLGFDAALAQHIRKTRDALELMSQSVGCRAADKSSGALFFSQQPRVGQLADGLTQGIAVNPAHFGKLDFGGQFFLSFVAAGLDQFLQPGTDLEVLRDWIGFVDDFQFLVSQF